MQNSRFIRDIIGEQVVMSAGYSELMKKIYMKEHGYGEKKANKGDTTDDKKNIDATESLLDLESVAVRFPSPVSLNMTNLNDQINNLTSLVDVLAPTIDVPAADQALAAPIFKREMFRKYLSNISWEEIDEIVLKVKEAVVRSKIRTPPTDDDMDPTDGGPSTDGDDAQSDDNSHPSPDNSDTP